MSDEIELYEVWDKQGIDTCWADGAVVDPSTGYETADLNDIWFQRDTGPVGPDALGAGQ